MKFDLIDQILEQDDTQIVAVKNVTISEEYLQDHFPSFPVLPGVMMLETLVQAARKLLIANGKQGHWVLGEVKNLRYGNMVRPGEQLRVSVSEFKSDDSSVTFKGEGKVGEETAVSGRLILRPARKEMN